MGQLGFFDLSRRYEGLGVKDDPLVAAMIPWEPLRPKLKVRNSHGFFYFPIVDRARKPGICCPTRLDLRPLKLAPLDILDTVFFRHRMERESREALFQAPANLRSMACAKLASAAGRGDETVKALHNG